jgi:hypothetical protein
MAVHQRKVSPTGGPVDVRLVVGHRHICSYRMVLMKGDGSSQQIVLKGDTVDTLPDELILPFPAPQLSGLFLALDGLLSPVQKGVEQRYSVEIFISQDGRVIDGNPVVIEEDTKVTVPILEYVEL